MNKRERKNKILKFLVDFFGFKDGAYFAIIIQLLVFMWVLCDIWQPNISLTKSNSESTEEVTEQVQEVPNKTVGMAEEIQRFLNLQYEDGKSEQEAFENLMEVLGLYYGEE